MPGAAHVAVGVFLAGGVVDGLDGLDGHQEGTFAVVDRAAGPGDGTFRLRRVSGSPRTDLQLHRALGILIFVCGLGSQGSESFAIDRPRDMIGGPVNGVGVKIVLASRIGQVGTTIIDLGVALSIIVGLDIGVINPKPLEIYLVQVVGL